MEGIEAKMIRRTAQNGHIFQWNWHNNKPLTVFFGCQQSTLANQGQSCQKPETETEMKMAMAMVSGKW